MCARSSWCVFVRLAIPDRKSTRLKSSHTDIYPLPLHVALPIYGLQGQDAAQPLAAPRWDWSDVRKVLVVRLRSIGDTVLATPSLFALKRFLPNAQVDILVEDWVAPVLDNHPHVDNVIVLDRGGLMARARVARELRAGNYDGGFNPYGGTA